MNPTSNSDTVARINALNELAFEVYTNAVLHGFHEHDFNFGEKIALIHSELSEALESFRKQPKDGPPIRDEHCPDFTNIEVELADAVIRILDLSEAMHLRIGNAIVAKHEYNKKRPYKHGKNF